ncbi:MAG: phosphonate degradation HD-domain oxygenase [Alphaproteobacteria bacterium]
MDTGVLPGRDVVAEVFELFAGGGDRHYGEGVTQREHALQCAALAARDGARPELIVAALLHDIGHLLQRHGENAAERGIDDRHEAIGAAWLGRRFGRAVVEPVRLHVAAKRFLCASEPDYFGRLSEASVRSLALQGGPMDAAEAATFAGGAWSSDAVALRRWDEAGKITDLDVPALERWADLIEICRDER